MAIREPDSADARVAVANSTLTAAQALAIAALAKGASLNEAAKAAGVERKCALSLADAQSALHGGDERLAAGPFGARP
ncbi:MAG TPA: hypothetical protein VFE47_13145 [Tepidisphaeraceae bacterium]|nr:hypothetical protein [Tepidisphaeraceae bacterium]